MRAPPQSPCVTLGFYPRPASVSAEMVSSRQAYGPGKIRISTSKAITGHRLAGEMAAPTTPDWERPYPQYQPVGECLAAGPQLVPGELCP